MWRIPSDEPFANYDWSELEEAKQEITNIRFGKALSAQNHATN